MKKLLIGFAFFGLMAYANPTQAKPQIHSGCKNVRIACCNGDQYMAIICDWENDPLAWSQILCSSCY
ncbi:MAG: hypothetical protein WC780_06745 [Lentimicrobiaceae bacterium]